MKYAELVIIGGGPAGLAAAVKARELNLGRIVLIERDRHLGGILQQCIHDGFGLHRFKKQLSGSEYAQRFIDEVQRGGIEVLSDTMVLKLSKEKVITASGAEHGLLTIQAGAIILAMGCRERTRPQVRIFGDRPAGVLTAGAVQRYINIEGWLPGKRAVILGSGDIGLIMARRMTLEGMEVEGVYEVMPHLGGLRRNKVQCLDDYGIPLHLSTTVVSVSGKKRLESVTVAKVGEDRKPIPGTERVIPCDLLVLSVGLIPENELSRGAGIELHPVTKGPVVNDALMTSLPGVFAAGNVAVVFDLVDYVSQTGETAALGAAEYLKGEAGGETVSAVPGENVSFVFPHTVRKDAKGRQIQMYLRVNKPLKGVTATVTCGKKTLYAKKHAVANPPEMLAISFAPQEELSGPIVVDVK
ncbi:MAG: NAD(P)/FAD-dependent oxidoreductase [Christensenellales bacterium]|jgi:NADPH-dependent 2,4-dienoyl-CoA reductase/sulfur reductase-like enzyme